MFEFEYFDGASLRIPFVNPGKRSIPKHSTFTVPQSTKHRHSRISGYLTRNARRRRANISRSITDIPLDRFAPATPRDVRVTTRLLRDASRSFGWNSTPCHDRVHENLWEIRTKSIGYRIADPGQRRVSLTNPIRILSFDHLPIVNSAQGCNGPQLREPARIGAGGTAGN